MGTAYLDTSAAMKLIFAEPGSDAMRATLDADPNRVTVASWLLHTELYCAVARRDPHSDPMHLTRLLEKVVLVDLARGDLLSAATHKPLRANDAIHLAVALRVGADELITYDRELADAARNAGLQVLSPGA